MPGPHRPHRLTRTLAAGVTAAALVAPAAIARPIDTPQRPDPTTMVRPPVVQKIDDGFDWGSAAIGAGGAGALVVIVAFGGVAYSTRHRLGVAR